MNYLPGFRLFAVLMLILLPVFPGPGAAQETGTADGEQIVQEAAVAPRSLQQALGERHSFRFVDEDIQVVLRGLARAYRFNITISPSVTGKVTANFRDVKIRDVIDNILKDFGYGYRESGDILRVTTLEKLKIEDENEAVRKQAQAMRLEAEKKQREAELAKEPLVIRVFRLKYVDANNVKDAIGPLLSQATPTQPAGTAVVLQTRQFTGFSFDNVNTYSQNLAAEETRSFVRSNTLIVKDKESVIREISDIIEKLDRKPNQILIDAKIIEVPIDQDFRLGLNWSKALNQFQVGIGDAGMSFAKSYERTRTGTDSFTHEWGSDWDGGRVSERVVSSERNSEISSKAESGTEFPGTGPFIDVSDSRLSSQKSSDARTRTDSDSLLNFDNYINSIADKVESIAGASNAASAILSAADFNVLISAMKSDSDIVILSNPRIIVHENYAANIFVGDRYPILSTEFDAAGGEGGAVGGTEVEEWREIGITLKVIPQLRKNLIGQEAINMIVHPAVSNIKGYAFSYAPDGTVYQSSYPIISIREADTNVTIANGDTLVIGGLIDSYTADETDKIPLLGDIPVLGYLFKEEHQQTRKTNLLIFLTAWVIDDTELSPYEKLMLEKAPPEALEDVRYVPDSEVRPYLYRNIEEPGLTEKGQAAEENPPAEEPVSAASEETEGSSRPELGAERRIQTKANERNPRL